MKTILLAALAIFSFSAIGQNTLKLKSGNYETASLEETRSYTNDELVEGNYYRILSFDQTPSSEAKNTLKQAGIQLLNYLPDNSYFAAIAASADLTIVDAKVLAIDTDYKLTYDLSVQSYPNWALNTVGDKVQLYAHYYETIDVSKVLEATKDFELMYRNDDINVLILNVDLDAVNTLYALPHFYYFASIEAPDEPENTDGRTDHRANTLRSEYTGGIFYRGEGVKVMMQDDGIVGEHIDRKGRMDQSGCAGCSTSPADSHGDHVSGTICGAGNLDPAGRGIADGAFLLVYGSSNNNYDAVPNLYTNDSLVITSKSYSSGCNSGYDSRAQQLDQQIRENPSLTHVFSAGNNGASACSGSDNYGAGCCWGNITGGHKSAKNVIAVGNLSKYDVLASSSSRGPATDGRIKPDICGVGTQVYSTYPDYEYESISGTSMSCPGVSGTIAQLYDAYRDDFGMNPSSALIKACILNTGEDLGNPGPDFKHGWGRINARRAYNTFHDNQFESGTLSQSGNNVHTINVPAGTDELRIMVYWADYEATVNAAPALVNNIDMVVTDPSFTNYFPWVLDPTPNATTLDNPAVQGVDDLNNMEQVTIQNPGSGAYQVSLSGTNIPQGPQEYYLVYYFVRDEITVTYPNGGEPIEPQETEVIRWDAKLNVGTFDVEYTLDNGATWTLIGTAPADQLYMNWFVPFGTSGLAKVRVTRGAISDESDAVFSVIDVPNNLDIEWACLDSANIIWDAVPGATSYEVSMLGALYMDSIGTTTATNLTVPLLSTQEAWFSVKALGPDNAVGERAIAIRKQAGDFNCCAVATIPTSTIPYFEGFENHTSFNNNDYWSTFNPDNNGTFNITSLAALSGVKSAYINNATQLGNYEDELISGPIDLSSLGASDILTLTYRYSYKKRFDTNDEWLRLYVQEACLSPWVLRKTLHGDQLSTETQISQWVPNADSQWVTVHVTNILSNFFTDEFRFKFNFESDGGNNLFLDNINIYQGSPSDTIVGLEEVVMYDLNVYPNPTDGELNIVYSVNSGEATTVRMYDITGKQTLEHMVMSQSGKNVIILDTKQMADGVYIAEIETQGVKQQVRVIVQ